MVPEGGENTTWVRAEFSGERQCAGEPYPVSPSCFPLTFIFYVLSIKAY